MWLENTSSLLSQSEYFLFFSHLQNHSAWVGALDESSFCKAYTYSSFVRLSAIGVLGNF